jgi:hypothetical protein
MVAPNIPSMTACFGRLAVLAVTNSPTAILSNSANSNKVLRVVGLWISNVDGTNAADITVDVFRGSTAFRLASTIAVPADATIDLLSKPLYLEEGDALRLTASANGDLEAVCSYEDIS